MRRAQAAFEFMTTYGWAMLVVLVGIGALAYYGIYDVKDTQAEQCILTAGLGCGGYQLLVNGNDAQLRLDVRNGMGKDIELQSVTINPGFEYSTTTCTDLNLGGELVEHGNDGIIICEYTLVKPLKNNEKGKLSVDLVYREEDGHYDKTAAGEIIVNAQKDASIGAPAPTCGDGNVDAGEECDDGGANGVCPATCSASCTTNVCVDPCGNGVIDAGEDCDGGDLNGQDCTNFPPNTDGTLSCSGGCTYDTSGCYYCGNNVKDGTEVCDGSDLGGWTCLDIAGFDKPGLACLPDCSFFDLTACIDCPVDCTGNGDDACSILTWCVPVCGYCN